MRILPIFLALGYLSAQNLSAQNKVAPVPADPHERVTGMAQVLATPGDRTNAMALLERAKQNSDMIHLGAFVAIKVSFNTQAGMGEISETWLSGRSWRYDQSLGGYSDARVGGGGQTFAKRVRMAPMPVQMVDPRCFGRSEEILR